MAARSWGFWTRAKLEILRDYLDAFTTTTKKKAPERIYLDLFAGQAENVDRLTGAQLQGSARIALSVDDPPFTRIRLFDRVHGHSLKAALGAEFPNRDLEVYADDCNIKLPEVLNELRPLNWAPTFAFLDPSGPDYRWMTIQALARFKEARKSKVELWILFPEPMFVRFLRIDGGQVRPQDSARITAMYGTDRWLRIYEARLNGSLEANQARHEYVNLMRWRLSSDLNYAWVHSFEVKNERGGPIYHMIFATDSEAGNKIMSHLYTRAIRDFPKMREEATEHRRGLLRLFDPHDYSPNDSLEPRYSYVAPDPPFGAPRSH